MKYKQFYDLMTRDSGEVERAAKNLQDRGLQRLYEQIEADKLSEQEVMKYASVFKLGTEVGFANIIFLTARKLLPFRD